MDGVRNYLKPPGLLPKDTRHSVVLGARRIEPNTTSATPILVAVFQEQNSPIVDTIGASPPCVPPGTAVLLRGVKVSGVPHRSLAFYDVELAHAGDETPTDYNSDVDPRPPERGLRK